MTLSLCLAPKRPCVQIDNRCPLRAQPEKESVEKHHRRKTQAVSSRLRPS